VCGGGHTARESVQNMHDWSRWPQVPHKNWMRGLSCITSSLQLLCISGVVVSQCPSRPAAVISSTVFDFDIVFAAITAISCCHWPVEQLHAITGRFGSIAVVSYDFVLCNTWRLFNSQGKIATLIRWGGLLLIVSHYLLTISCKKYNYMFEFVKVMSQVLSVPFLPGHGVVHRFFTAKFQKNRTPIMKTFAIFEQKISRIAVNLTCHLEKRKCLS